MALVTVKKSRQDPDSLYPYPLSLELSADMATEKGKRWERWEIALFLMGTAVMIGWDSYIALQDILANNVVNDYGASSNFYTYLVGTFSPGHGRAVPACWASASWRRKRSTA